MHRLIAIVLLASSTAVGAFYVSAAESPDAPEILSPGIPDWVRVTKETGAIDKRLIFGPDEIIPVAVGVKEMAAENLTIEYAIYKPNDTTLITDPDTVFSKSMKVYPALPIHANHGFAFTLKTKPAAQLVQGDYTITITVVGKKGGQDVRTADTLPFTLRVP